MTILEQCDNDHYLALDAGVAYCTFSLHTIPLRIRTEPITVNVDA